MACQTYAAVTVTVNVEERNVQPSGVSLTPLAPLYDDTPVGTPLAVLAGRDRNTAPLDRTVLLSLTRCAFPLTSLDEDTNTSLVLVSPRNCTNGTNLTSLLGS